MTLLIAKEKHDNIMNIIPKIQQLLCNEQLPWIVQLLKSGKNWKIQMSLFLLKEFYQTLSCKYITGQTLSLLSDIKHLGKKITPNHATSFKK